MCLEDCYPFGTCSGTCCSDLPLLCIDSQHLFLQHHAAIFVPAYDDKTDQLGHLPPQIHIESHSSVNWSLLVSSQMDLISPFCISVTIGSTCLYVLKQFPIG